MSRPSFKSSLIILIGSILVLVFFYLVLFDNEGGQLLDLKRSKFWLFILLKWSYIAVSLLYFWWYFVRFLNKRV